MIATGVSYREEISYVLELLIYNISDDDGFFFLLSFSCQRDGFFAGLFEIHLEVVSVHKKTKTTSSNINIPVSAPKKRDEVDVSDDNWETAYSRFRRENNEPKFTEDNSNHPVEIMTFNAQRI